MKSKAWTEKFMQGVFFIAACASVLAVALICIFLFANGLPAMKEIGFGKFLTGTIWKPNNDIYGILPMIVGSLYVTAGAIIVGVPIGILTAVFMAFYCPKQIYKPLKTATELLAGIPSVVKNNSLETVAVYLDEEKKQIERNKKTGKIALDNLKSILGVISNLKDMQDPNLESLRNLFYSSVVYLINEIQPHTLGDGIPYLPEINTGRAFSHLITICYYWLSDRQEELALPNVEKYIPKDLYNSAKEVLENVSKINDPV